MWAEIKVGQAFTLDSLLGESFPPSLCFRGFRILVEGMCHLASVDREEKSWVQPLKAPHHIPFKSSYFWTLYAPESWRLRWKNVRLTCRPGPLQGGLPLPVDLSVTPLDVPCPLVEDRGGTPGERKRRKMGCNSFSVYRASSSQRKASIDSPQMYSN